VTEVLTSDGFRLWFEAAGDGPALIFPSRTRDEHRDLARALAGSGRVVRYIPRHATGLDEPSWSMDPRPSGAFDPFPVDLEIDDLHRVADAAAVGEFVLAGYSGMGALAAFLAPVSDRATGLLVGGFPFLGPWDYWLGVADGAYRGHLVGGRQAEAEHSYASARMFQAWTDRDDRAALAALPGPKIVWYGGADGEPGCALHAVLAGAAVARRLHAATPTLHALGFTVIEIAGLDHAAGLYDTEAVAPVLAETLLVGWSDRRA
jgi:hypothetical protein